METKMTFPSPASRRRHLAQLGAGAIALLGGLPAKAAGYPERPLRLVVPYAAGAAGDLLGRILADRLGLLLGQAIIVDNRAGAGGTLGADNVAKAAPDGYTLLLGTDASQATNVFLSKRFPYDPVKSFTPVAAAATNHIVLLVHPSFPARTVAELVQYAKSHPGKLSFGSSGPGSAHHLAGQLLNEAAGIDMVHVAYKGGSPAMTDLLGGQLQVLFASLSTARPYLDSGKVRALGVVEAARVKGLPQVPAIGETLPGYEVNSWFAVFGPAGLPTPVVARLGSEINKVLAQPSVVDLLEKNGLSPWLTSPEELAKRLKSELQSRERLVKAAGLEAE